jgi:diguanylate cyclase (GGDEF)-like protein
MEYTLQISQVKNFVDYYARNSVDELNKHFKNPLSEFKQTAYSLFYKSIKISLPYVYEEPHPISQFFFLLRKSCQRSKNKIIIIKQLESWWLEWHFALAMSANAQNESMLGKGLMNTIKNGVNGIEPSHFATLFTQIPIPICNVSIVTGEIIRVNQRFIDVIGYTIEDVPTLSIWWEKAYPDEKYRTEVLALWETAMTHAQEHNSDIPPNNYCIRCKNGTDKMMDVSGIIIGDEFLAVLNDATERLEVQELLNEMAFLDSLTKIANRRRFDERLAREFSFAQTNNTHLSLIMIDIDNFKKFNDRYGHVAGDVCLHDIAQKIASIVSRTDDFVARYGGEEFAVLLPHTDHHGALFVAEEIQKAIERLAISHEDSFTGVVSLSLGITATDNMAIDSATALVEKADSALYYAKEQGRNCIALSNNLSIGS